MLNVLRGPTENTGVFSEKFHIGYFDIYIHKTHAQVTTDKKPMTLLTLQ
jgi:hypothetical protein